MLSIFGRKSSSSKPLLRADLGLGARRFGIESYQERTSARELVTRYGKWVYLCVNLRANCAASIPLRLFSIGNKGIVEKCLKYRPRPLDRKTLAFFKGNLPVKPCNAVMRKVAGQQDDMTELSAHDVLDLFCDVNPQDEGFSFRNQMYRDMDVFGEHDWNIVTTGNVPSELHRMMPQYLTIYPHTVKFYSHFEYGFGAEKIRLEPDEVLRFLIPDPNNRWLPYGPLAAWLKSIDADYAMTAFQEDVFSRGGMPDWLLISKGAMTDPQKHTFRTMFRELFAGHWFNANFKRREHIAIADGDATMQKLSDSPKELDYSVSQLQKRDEICAAFNVPRAFVDSDKVAANAREAMNQFKMLAIWPVTMRVEETWNQKFLPRFWSDRLVLVHDNPLEEDRTIRIQERASQLGAGYSVNQILIADGEEPLDDPNADIPLVASTFTTLDRVVNPPEPLDPFGMPGGTMGGSHGRSGGNPDGAADKSAGRVCRDRADRGSRTATNLGNSLGTMHMRAEGGLGGLPGKGEDAGYDGGGNDLAGGLNETENQVRGIADHVRVAAGQQSDNPAEPNTSRTARRRDNLHHSSGHESQTQELFKAWEGVEHGHKHRSTVSSGTELQIAAGERVQSVGVYDQRGGNIPARVGNSYISAVEKCWHLHLKDAQEDLPESGSVRGFIARMDATLRKQVKEMTDALVAQGLTPAAAVEAALLVVMQPEWVDLIADAARPFIGRAIEIGGKFGMDKLSLPEAVGFDVSNPEVQRFIDNYSVRLASAVNRHTEVSARDLLGDGLHRGESIPELRQRVQDWAGKVNDPQRATLHRAENIARTESARAYVQGETEAWKQSGVVQGKQWLLAPDACEFCEAAAAEYAQKTIPLTQSFFAQGTTLQGTSGGRMTLDYDDVDGPPLHPSCRCDLSPVLESE